MSDDMFLFQFENCTLPKENFKHQGHLRLAWLYLNNYSFDQAFIHLSQGILRFATSLNAQHIYHETLTRVWLHLVHQAMHQPADNFSAFIANNPHLLDKHLPLHYYSHAHLFSDLARKQWVEPDLKAIA